jgi:hypothetical protein
MRVGPRRGEISRSKECGRHEDEHVCDHGSPSIAARNSRVPGGSVRSTRIGPPPGSTVTVKRRNLQHWRSASTVRAMAARMSSLAAKRRRQPPANSSRRSARPTRLWSRPSRRAFRAAGLNVQATGRSGTDRSVTARLETRNQAPRCAALRRPRSTITVGGSNARSGRTCPTSKSVCLVVLAGLIFGASLPRSRRGGAGSATPCAESSTRWPA